MITRTEAERVAVAIHTLRQDWPVASLTTLIVRDLTDWPLLELFVGLAHVAAEQNLDGTWVSQTPARVKEQGPWRTVGVSNAVEDAARKRAIRELEERKSGQRMRARLIDGCRLCDRQGYLLSGAVCVHDPAAASRAHAGAELARQAFRDARKLTPTLEEGVTE